MASPPSRTQESYLQFLLYLHETGLDEELREICKHHHVTPRDIYLDTAGPTAHAARLEAWWWLLTFARKSLAEVARIFDRDSGSIRYGMLKLGERARLDGLELSATNVRLLAIVVAGDTHNRRVRSGKERAERAMIKKP